MALFREYIEAAFSLESIEACVIPGRTELLPAHKLSYVAFVDPSGGRRDQVTAYSRAFADHDLYNLYGAYLACLSGGSLESADLLRAVSKVLREDRELRAL
jgi:hypothetical protein